MTDYINPLARLQFVVQQQYPDLRISLTRLPETVVWELEIHVRREHLVIEWRAGGVFGVVVLNERNQWDRRFAYYNDVEFQRYDETRAYILQYIKNRLTTSRL